MKLAELQRRMFAEITNTVISADYIKPNARLTARERLDIYRDQYWSRLIDSLRDDFPGLLLLLGERAFQKLAIEYLTACPSKSFTLRDLGQHLPAHLQNQPLEHDMARLEWAHIETYDALESEPLSATFTPDQALALQPHIRLLELQYPVDDVRLKTLSARAVKARRPATIHLATHRVEGDVFYRRLEPGEFAILQKLSTGKSLAKALRGIIANPEDLQRWFATWAQLGWLCHPPAKRTSARSRGQ